MVFWVRSRGAENFEKKKKTDRRKTLKKEEKKNKEYKKSKITAINIFGFPFYIKKYIFLESIVCKKAVYIINFCLEFLCIAGYLKRSNDTPSLIYKRTQIIVQ